MSFGHQINEFQFKYSKLAKINNGAAEAQNHNKKFLREDYATVFV